MKRYKPLSGQDTLPLVNSLYTNYRAELYVAGLIDRGLSLDSIRVLRKGKSQRGNAKEVDQVSWEYAQDEMLEYLSVYVNKRDLYDSLPEGLFHNPSVSEKKRGKTGIVDMIRKAREEEFHARFFFKPFEMAIDRMLISVQLYEQCLEKRDVHKEFIRLLHNDWKILRNIPLDKALFILAFLSQRYRILEAEHIAQILSVFLGCSVHIQQESKLIDFEDETQWNLGDGRLGLTTFIGGKLTDNFSVFNVQIEGLPRKHWKLINSDSSVHLQFQNVLEIFLPADAEIFLTFKAIQEEAYFTLSDNPEQAPLLGFTTLLSL